MLLKRSFLDISILLKANFLASEGNKRLERGKIGYYFYRVNNILLPSGDENMLRISYIFNGRKNIKLSQICLLFISLVK